VTRLYILGPEIGQPRAELRISNCGLHHIIVSTFFLVNEKEKTPKLVKKERIFTVVCWTEFQTRFQMLRLSLKLGLKFFLRLCVFENDRNLGLSLKLDPDSLDQVLNSVPASC
jgi:hypothetical protein